MVILWCNCLDKRWWEPELEQWEVADGGESGQNSKMHISRAGSSIWWGRKERRSKGWLTGLLSTYHFGLPIIKKECLVSLCTMSFKTHPQQFIYCFSTFHMEIWELYVELYTNRWVFRPRHPIFALVHTQIFGHLTTSWMWLVIVKEFIVITMPNMEI